MTTRKELRELTYKKIKTIKRLIADEEWEVAAYLMGYVLECALKAASCKALNLQGYPPVKFRSGNEGTGFKTHEFEQLLIVSGLNDLFGSLSATPAYSNWSDFTINFSGVWTQMRYEDMSARFDEASVKELARNLYDDSDSIIETIKKESPMVDKFKTILAKIHEDNKQVSLFAVLKIDDLTDRWSIIFSAPDLEDKDKRQIEFNYLVGLLTNNLDEGEIRSIARVGVFPLSNHLVDDLLKYKTGYEFKSPTQANGNVVHEGYILESDGVVE